MAKFCSLPVVLLALAWLSRSHATDERPCMDLSKDKVLYIVSTAHLDTQWNWTIEATINSHIPKTLRENFAIFAECPNYKFSFEGAFRYMLMEEYYPQEFAKLKEYVAQDRWKVAGSFVDACDVNIVSPEALIRQVLHGNGYFRRTFGKTSRDVFLPDCFGFGYALPSAAAHCGLKGFSTQKLTWGSWIGIPFDIGIWQGVDGSQILAALNPGGYGAKLGNDIRADKGWQARIETSGQQTGVYAGYKYIGTGDTGGSPGLGSGQWLEKCRVGDGPFKVLSAASDQLFRDLTPNLWGRLPRYDGELLLTTHGVGCYSSQSAMKRWNRKNQLWGDTAERAALLAAWLGGSPYPRERIRDAWVRFLWHQFHDDLTGTSTPRAYEFSWNDELLALNQFSAVLGEGVGAASCALDTRAEGVPLVVFNPLGTAREDIVEARVRFPGPAPKAVRVFDPRGQEVPAQLGEADDVGQPPSAVPQRSNTAGGGCATVVFLAATPPVGLSVYDVRPAQAPCAIQTGLQVDEKSLANKHLQAALDVKGDLVGLKLAALGKELLKGPARYSLSNDQPSRYPAWEIAFKDVDAPARGFIEGGLKTRVVERGPARVCLEVTRETDGSKITQRWRLAAGEAGARLECDLGLNWQTRATLLKALFPLTCANPNATYDLGLGCIERPNNTPKRYEVPAQQWADLSAPDGSYGVAILNDCKHGWDKPADDALRLTLLHVPAGGRGSDQDQGQHRVLYALYGHAGDWRGSRAPWQAARLNQPLLAFQTTPHEGSLGKEFSFAAVDTPQVALRALKQAEDSDEVVVRLQELDGKPAAKVGVSFAAPVVAAREVNGAEEPVGPAEVKDGKLVADLGRYQPRAFALKLAPPPAKLTPPPCQAVTLPFDQDVVSRNENMADGDFDGQNHTLPAELFPETLVCQGITFKLGPAADGAKNALACRGQKIPLPADGFNRVYLLAAAAGDQKRTFAVGDKSTELEVQEYSGFIGQWDRPPQTPRNAAAVPGRPGFIKRDIVALALTHRHLFRPPGAPEAEAKADTKAPPSKKKAPPKAPPAPAAPGVNEPYVFCYLFKYRLDLPPGATTLTLPDNEKIKLFAVTVARNDSDSAWRASPDPE